jgi:hypothetical protein
VAPKPDSSRVYSQEPSGSLSWANWIHFTAPQPIFFYYIFWSHPHIYSLGFWVVSFTPKPCTIFSPLPRIPHSPWFDLLNNIWGWVQNMKFLIVQLAAVRTWNLTKCLPWNIFYYKLIVCMLSVYLIALCT